VSCPEILHSMSGLARQATADVNRITQNAANTIALLFLMSRPFVDVSPSDMS
jgi:hypothetical protein